MLPEQAAARSGDLLAGVFRIRATGSSTTRRRSAFRSPIEYYLPALKVQVDFAQCHVHLEQLVLPPQRDRTRTRERSTTSRTIRRSAGRTRWVPYAPSPSVAVRPSTTPTEPCSWYPLLDGHGHSHAARIRELLDAEHHDQPATLLDAGVPSAVERPRCPCEVDGRRVLVARAGAQRRAAQRSAASTAVLSAVSESLRTASTARFYSCPGTGYNTVVSPTDTAIATSTTTTTRATTGRSRDSAKRRYRLTDHLSLVSGARYSKLGFSLNHYSNGYENYAAYWRLRRAPSRTERIHAEVRPRLAGGSEESFLLRLTRRDSGPAASTHPCFPYADRASLPTALPTASRRSTYKSDTTQSYETRLEE